MSWRDAPLVEEQQPAQPMSRFQRFITGLADPIVGAEQLLHNISPEPVRNALNRADEFLHDRTGGVIGRGVDPDTFARQREQEIQARRAAAGQEGFDGMRLTGNIVNPVNLVGGAFRAPATVAGRLAQSSGIGATMGVTAPVTEGDPDDFMRQTAQQAGIGAATGVVGDAALRPLANLAGRGGRPDVQTLTREGVNPTTAQIAGGRARATEEALTSVPVLGGAIAGRQREAVQQFNQAAINRAVRPIGGQAQGTGMDGVEAAARQLDQAYDAARGMVRDGVPLDGTFQTQLEAVREAGEGLTTGMARKLNNVLERQITAKARAGRLSADDFKRLDSALGREIARYRKSPDAPQQDYADVLMDVQHALRDQLVRTNPDAAQAFRAADDGYRHLVILERAANRARNNDGLFTPAQLLAEASRADTRVRNRGIIEGTATFADLARAGQNVLGARVPDSGTAGRGMMGVVGAGLGYGAATAPGTTAMAAGGLVGSALAYRGMDPLLRRAITSPGGGQILQSLPRAGAAGGGQAGGRLGPGLLMED